jgi:hypothetical protein
VRNRPAMLFHGDRLRQNRARERSSSTSCGGRGRF